MNDRISTPWIPAWIPHSGHALRHAGIHFDAVRLKGAAGNRTLSYVGVPALTGVTWPLGWRSVPTKERLFVVGKLLEEVAGRVLAAGAVK
ncbi:hypothetical protein [Streptomyces roseochromogenus]|uniref:Uncharacterized protein n=1 Tax=Streptomyces roseochromogenus subsp. oscitans DS 12.976 TaxID=1352936 RepID=V6K8S8_STRRC|nr:hypothetical protein [Streptomyces roseochromogenus]EST27811.1 hypothetical protein M878_24120 [Streptomyces roseochromogenus subsp. oscitans DS 12.976]